MTRPYDRLAPEVWARTILAAQARVQVAREEGNQADQAPVDHAGILLDHTGAVWLVLDAGAEVSPDLLLITCRAGMPGLGVLRLEGHCTEPVDPSSLPALAGLLERHLVRSGERSYGTGDTATDTDDVVLAPVRLREVYILPPPAGTDVPGRIAVDPAAFASARPDRWIVDLASARDRLERTHQHELCTLAHDLTGLDCSAVVVRTMGPERLDLVCLSTSGVTCLQVGFGTALDHPSLVQVWLAARSRRTT